MDARHEDLIDPTPPDDAVAILSRWHPELDVLGITAVAGNVPLKLTETNARKICELAGKPDVKVFSGAIRPLMRPLVTAEEVHGKTGLNGPQLPEPIMKLQDGHAVDFIVETLMSQESGAVTLCALGPLTTSACFDPPADRTPHRADVRFAAASRSGNVTPPPILHLRRPSRRRPRAALGGPVVICRSTHAPGSDHARLTEAFPALGTKVGGLSPTCWNSRRSTSRNPQPMSPAHDPCVRMAVQPTCSSHSARPVETHRTTMGRTLADWWG